MDDKIPNPDANEEEYFCKICDEPFFRIEGEKLACPKCGADDEKYFVRLPVDKEC